jgi:hypothetical protein
VIKIRATPFGQDVVAKENSIFGLRYESSRIDASSTLTCVKLMKTNTIIVTPSSGRSDSTSVY